MNVAEAYPKYPDEVLNGGEGAQAGGAPSKPTVDNADSLEKHF